MGHAEDADDEPPTNEPLNRRPRTVALRRVVDVDCSLAEALDLIRIPLRAERDDERVGVPAVPVDLRRTLRRVDRADGPTHDSDPTFGEARQRPFALGKSARVEYRPVLAQAHDECRPTVDEDDLVGGIEPFAQGDRGGDPAKASAEDQDAARWHV